MYSSYTKNIHHLTSLFRHGWYLLVISLFFLPTLVSASTISLSPSSGDYNSNQTFTATIQVQPAGNDVNAVEAQLSFDTTTLEVVNVSQDGSVFSLWTTEPTFSNADGTISFGGGSPTPFTSPSTAVTVTFRATEEGSASVSFDDVSILIADGQGTDAFAGATDASYTIAATETTPEPSPEPTPTPESDQQPIEDEEEDNEEETLTFGDPPRAPEIGSQTFLDQDEWYDSMEGLFTWSLPFDVSAVAVEISTSSDNVPYENADAVFDPPIEEFQVSEDNIDDGVQYISMAYENQVGWGTVLNRRVKIDTVPPESFSIDVVPGRSDTDFPTLQFQAEDPISGIDHYELFVDDREPVVVTPDEAELGYLLSRLEDGTYTVRVIAYDQAGNSTEATTPVLIRAGWEPPQDDDDEWSIWDIFTGANLLIFALLLITGLLIVYIWYERKWAAEREEKLQRETREIQDQMEKIFSALRDEIYDEVNTITKRKRLSAKEREAIENVNQALEVSETLIEKEINDVKSILR